MRGEVLLNAKRQADRRKEPLDQDNEDWYGDFLARAASEPNFLGRNIEKVTESARACSYFLS